MNFSSVTNPFGDSDELVHRDRHHLTRTSHEASNEMALMMKPTNQILVSESIRPIRQLREAQLNEAIRNFLSKHAITELNEFDWFAWPTILRGRNLFAMPEDKDSTHLRQSAYQEKIATASFNSFSYLFPLLSLILDSIEHRSTDTSADTVSASSKGYIKKSMFMQAKNGPILLIVCASCSRGIYFFTCLFGFLV
jgi:hypothetical protein